MKSVLLHLAPVALFVSCAGVPVRSSGAEDLHPQSSSTVEYTTIASDSDENARDVASYFDGSGPDSIIKVRTPLRSARVKSIELSSSDAGDPLLHVELSDRDKPAFQAFTKEHLDQPLVVLVQGRYVLYANLMDPLPGTFLIWGCTMEEAESLAEWFEK